MRRRCESCSVCSGSEADWENEGAGRGGKGQDVIQPFGYRRVAGREALGALEENGT